MQNKRCHAVLTCGRRLPGPINVRKSNKGCKFYNLANTDPRKCKEVSREIRGNRQRTLKPNKKKCEEYKTKEKPKMQEETPEYEPHITERTNVLYSAIHDIEGHTYTDLTGRFPKTSSRGYKYILVLYDYDGNIIQSEPMKNRSDAEVIRAYSRIYDELASKGLKPKFQAMDNEASTALKRFLHSKDIQFQLVTPHVHHQSAAERAIQTFKYHFVAMLYSTEKQFPIHLWDRLIPQAVIILNLIRQSRLNPKFSARAQLNGLYDYNKTPLAPPGTKVIIHEKSDHRGSWSPHGLSE
jgi:hypothetical protein